VEARFLTFTCPISDLGVLTVDIGLWDYAANADKSFVFEDPEYMLYHFLPGDRENVWRFQLCRGGGNISLRFLAIEGLLAYKARSCWLIDSTGFNIIIGSC
jgi:hypothetical protein